MDNLALRNTILRSLKKEGRFKNAVVVETNGNYFSAMDIGLSSGEAYRITIIKHKQEKSFATREEALNRLSLDWTTSPIGDSQEVHYDEG